MTHGLSNTRLYGIFHNMKQRCYNPNDPKYSSYGGKGITICKEWLDDFTNFYNWAMENGYSEDLTIDRKESGKGYCPENCRWITFEENRKRGNALTSSENGSRASYFRARRKDTKAFYVEVAREKMETFEEVLSNQGITKKDWLEKKIEEEIKIER